MEIALYFSDVRHLLDYERVLQRVEFRKLPSRLLQIFNEETNAAEYLAHLKTLEFLDKFGVQRGAPSRLYFGQEFCEALIPDPDEVMQAYYVARQIGWNFTYVTGPLTAAGLVKVRANLERLAAVSTEFEVVVNDWGLLATLCRDFAGAQPVLGRLQVKQKRLGFYPPRSLPVNMVGIDTPETEIRQNQLNVLRGLNLALDEYRQLLAEYGVRRVDLDVVPQGVDVPTDKWGLGFGFYFPWAYLAGGRNCLTAAIADPVRAHLVVDKPCPRPCRSLNRSSVTAAFPKTTIQRGNAVFVLRVEDAGPYMEEENRESCFDRIIVEPYIPI